MMKNVKQSVNMSQQEQWQQRGLEQVWTDEVVKTVKWQTYVADLQNKSLQSKNMLKLKLEQIYNITLSKTISTDKEHISSSEWVSPISVKRS